MGGRKQPDVTEGEATQEYRRSIKRSHGDDVAGEAKVPDRGPAGDVRRERERWAREHERKGD